MHHNKITVLILTITLSLGAFIYPFISATDFSYATDSIEVSDDPEIQFTSNFITFCALAGLNITGNGAAPYVMDKLQSFCTDSGRGMQQFITDVNNGAGIVADQTGLYRFNKSAWSLMNDLYDYIFTSENIENNRGDLIGVASTRSFTASNGKIYYLYVKDASSNIILKHGTPVVPLSYFANHKDSENFFPYTLTVYKYSGSNNYNITRYSTDKIYCSTLGNANQSDYFLYERYGSTYTLGSFCYFVTSNNQNYIYIGLVQSASNRAYYTVKSVTGLGTTETNTVNNLSFDIPDDVKTPSQMDNEEPAEGENNTYNINYNTYNDIIDNSSTVTITNINNDPDDDINYNPYPDNPNYDPNDPGSGTITGPSNSGGGDGSDDTEITFPDFDFHFPEIDWSLGDLSEKFPFSIPFDLIAFFTVLNATPEAPAIDADIPLGDWYTWHFEADFSQFDNYAAIIRNVEFIAFCIGLIYLTIRLVKG